MKRKNKETENNNEKQKNETINKILKYKKKTIMMIGLIILIVTLFIIAIKIIILPSLNYNKANNYIKSKKYENAIKLYEKNIDYKDSKEKIKKAYYEYGIMLIDDKKYEDAIKIFKKANGDEIEKYISYANAMLDFNEEKYNTALSTFQELVDFKDSNDYVNYSNLMLAEVQYKDGNLSNAKKMFESLDKDLEINGIKVSNRLDLLEKYKDYVNLCGTWMGTNGKMSVRQTHDSTGLWNQWDGEYTDYLQLKCIINEDGTVTLKGDAQYYIYTNYSSLSKYLKELEKSLVINKTVSSIPSEIASGTNVKLTYSGNKFSLVYDYNDENSSMNFTYRYKSSITYNTEVSE